jgi:hypothetical protein
VTLVNTVGFGLIVTSMVLYFTQVKLPGRAFRPRRARQRGSDA